MSATVLNVTQPGVTTVMPGADGTPGTAVVRLEGFAFDRPVPAGDPVLTRLAQVLALTWAIEALLGAYMHAVQQPPAATTDLPIH